MEPIMTQCCRFIAIVLVAATAIFTRPASAVTYPDHPIKLIVPFAAGGGNDVIGRIVGKLLEERFGQRVLILNEPGAGGLLATRMAASSPPDGYTILLTPPGYAIIATSTSLKYDPIGDFAPISLIAVGPEVLFANPKLPVKDVRELVAAAKEQPGRIFFASGGVGSMSHLTGELFKLKSGAPIQNVSYRGGNQMLSDTIAGVTQLVFINPSAAMPAANMGLLRPLGVASLQRWPLLKDIPTVAEQGVEGYEAEYWYGLQAPANTPPEIIDKLNKTLRNALTDPSVEARFNKMGFMSRPSSPAELRSLIEREIVKWGDVVKKAGVVFQ
jgi:tripartite-type tricarboxylate transporter receptor subunit TctC